MKSAKPRLSAADRKKRKQHLDRRCSFPELVRQTGRPAKEVASILERAGLFDGHATGEAYRKRIVRWHARQETWHLGMVMHEIYKQTGGRVVKQAAATGGAHDDED